MTNFIINVAEGAYEKVAEALSAIGHTLAPVENVVKTDVQTALSTAEALLERNGSQILFSEALAVADGVATGNWTSLVSTLVGNAKAAGASTVAAEEQLAGSTALQLAQVIQAAQINSVVPATALISTVGTNTATVSTSV